MSDGLFVVLEGIDGCGKGTQMKRLANKLFDMNKRHHVVMTREPGRSDYGIEIRKILAETNDPYQQGVRLAQLFVDDRRRHVEGIILPTLAYGGIALSDRYKHSTLTFQHAQGIPMDELLAMHEGLPVPDLTVILDVPSEVGMARIGKDTSREKPESFEKLEFQEKLRWFYRGLCLTLKDETIKIIDANRKPEEIEIDVLNAVMPYLEKVK